MLNSINNKRTTFFLVNFITLMRVALSIYFSTIIFYNTSRLQEYLIVFSFIAFSDFCDGKLARKYGVESKMGSLLDVLSDFFFMVSAYISLVYNRLLPIWIIYIINLKMLEFFITSRIMSTKKVNNFFVFDGLGKTVAISFYILPIVIIIMRNLFSNKFYHIQNILLYIIVFFTIISMGHRIYYSTVNLKE